ncbi:MAG: FKBP-type peptidyl-prolyl cis-trans isomerase [Gemmatimonadota bacterium]
MRKNLNTQRFLGLGLVILATGCLGDSVGPVDPADQTFATGLGVNLSEMTLTQSGLYYKDEVVGTGAVATLGSAVTVDYTGWLHTGFRFDGGTFQVPSLGAGDVIAGWDEGLQGMKVGGRRLLVIPSHLAYGASGRGSIPPYATLVFRVEVRGVTP